MSEGSEEHRSLSRGGNVHLKVNNNMMKVIRKKTHWILSQERLLLEAAKDESIIFDSFFGKREWWLHQGDRITIIVGKSEMIEAGDGLNFGYCVHKDFQNFFGGHQIPWRWL